VGSFVPPEKTTHEFRRSLPRKNPSTRWGEKHHRSKKDLACVGEPANESETKKGRKRKKRDSGHSPPRRTRRNSAKLRRKKHGQWKRATKQSLYRRGRRPVFLKNSALKKRPAIKLALKKDDNAESTFEGRLSQGERMKCPRRKREEFEPEKSGRMNNAKLNDIGRRQNHHQSRLERGGRG